MDLQVFVIILNWNRPIETKECIESVTKLRYRNLRIIVVDNGSTDASVSLLQREFADIDVLKTGVNLGFAGGMNVGITFALKNGADFVLLLNNDTIVDPGMLATLIEASGVNPGYSIVGPTIFYYDDKDRIWYKGGVRKRFWPAIIGLSCESPNLSSEDAKVIPVDVVSGCGMLVSRSVFEEVGLFDPKFFMYYEDTDFCLRARKHGYNVGYVPSASMWHKVSWSTKDNAPIRIYARAKSKAIFYKRYAAGFATLTTWPFLILSVFSTLWQDIRTRQTILSKYYLKGIVDGLLFSE